MQAESREDKLNFRDTTLTTINISLTKTTKTHFHINPKVIYQQPRLILVKGKTIARIDCSTGPFLCFWVICMLWLHLPNTDILLKEPQQLWIGTVINTDACVPTFHIFTVMAAFAMVKHALFSFYSYNSLSSFSIGHWYGFAQYVESGWNALRGELRRTICTLVLHLAW